MSAEKTTEQITNHASKKHPAVYIVKATVACGVFYYLLHRIDLRQIAQHITSVNPWYVVLAFALALLFRYLNAYQTQILLKNQDFGISLTRVFSIQLISGFYTLFLPGNLSGSAVKWYKLSQKNGKRIEALSVVVITRLLNILSIIGIGLICLMLNNPFNSLQFNLILPGLLALAVLPFGIILHRPAFEWLGKNFFSRLLKKSPAFIKNAGEKIGSSIKKFHDLSRREILFLFFTTLFIQIAGICTQYTLAVSVNIKLSIIILCWVRSVAVLLQMLPISFLGLGVREGTYVFLFGKYNVPASETMAFSLLVLGFNVIISLAGGLLELWDLFGKRERQA